ncbi:MAG TPA: four helix bundle protein [Thermomicrobiales bacterium]|nr:four helix bundle protein [Thermomicrobiales bacterium]
MELYVSEVSNEGTTLFEEEAGYTAIRNFEDLIAWQRARELTAEVYMLARARGLRQDFGLRDQLQRAAVSVMSNIAEGHERGSSREYFRFLTIAKASCAEVSSLLYVAHDAGYIDEDAFRRHLDTTRRVGQLVGALRSSISRRIDSQRR